MLRCLLFLLGVSACTSPNLALPTRELAASDQICSEVLSFATDVASDNFVAAQAANWIPPILVGDIVVIRRDTTVHLVFLANTECRRTLTQSQFESEMRRITAAELSDTLRTVLSETSASPARAGCAAIIRLSPSGSVITDTKSLHAICANVLPLTGLASVRVSTMNGVLHLSTGSSCETLEAVVAPLNHALRWRSQKLSLLTRD